EALDPLGGPVRAYLGALPSPDLLGVGLEEHQEEAPPEPVRHPALEGAVFGHGEELLAGVAERHPSALEEAHAPERLKGLEGVMEEAAAVEDAREAADPQET